MLHSSSSILLFFFFLFSSVALLSAVMVISGDNPVYSALFLILVFFNSGLLVLLLDLEFLALIFILIYIGAIMVLVLFVVMMLDIKQTVIHVKRAYYFVISGFFLMTLGGELLYFIASDLTVAPKNSVHDYLNWFTLIIECSNIKNLGLYLYTYFSLPFILAGLILLVAMLGAISLTLEDSSESARKHQQLFNQLNIEPKDSIFYIK